MRKRFPSLVIGLMLLLRCVTSQAAINVGDKPQLQAKSTTGQNIDLKQLSGKLVLVDFWATWCGPCMNEAPHMVQINKDYASKGLVMIGISLDGAASDIAPVAKAKEMTWQQLWAPGDWHSTYAQTWGVNSIPQTFLISPDGTVLWRGHPAQLDEVLKKAFKEHPPQLVSPEVRKQAEDAFAQIDSALEDKNYPQAMKLLSSVPVEASSDPKLAARIEKIHDRVSEFAESMLASVDPLIEQKNYVQAISKLRDLSDQLAGTPVGTKARQKLSDLAGDPQVRKQIDAEDRIRKADAALAEAQKLQDAKQDKAAYQRFSEITRVFSGTDAAIKAKAAVAEYEKDPAFVKNVVNADRARKAAAALSMADGYKSAGLTDKAKSKYQEVIDQFPSTPQAKAAADSLQTLAGN